MEPSKKKSRDSTSGTRAASHLARLAAANGKRLPIDLFANHLAQINDLIAGGYGTTAVAVIRRAIEDAHAAQIRRSESED